MFLNAIYFIFLFLFYFLFNMNFNFLLNINGLFIILIVFGSLFHKLLPRILIFLYPRFELNCWICRFEDVLVL